MSGNRNVCMANAIIIGLGVCFSSKFNLDYFAKLDLCGGSSLPVDILGPWQVICFCVWVCVFVRKQTSNCLTFGKY